MAAKAPKTKQKTDEKRLRALDPMDDGVKKRVLKAIKGGGTISTKDLRAYHVAVYGDRPNRAADAEADPTEWDARYDRDIVRARRAGVLAKRDGGLCAAPEVSESATYRFRKPLGRDDVTLWGRPFTKEAAFAIVRALGNKWGPDVYSVKKNSLVAALTAHGYTFTGSAIDGCYEIVDPVVSERDKLTAKIEKLQAQRDALSEGDRGKP